MTEITSKVLEFSLWGVITISHGVCGVVSKIQTNLPATLHAIGEKISPALHSPDSVARTDGDWEVVDSFNAPDVISDDTEGGIQLQLMEEGSIQRVSTEQDHQHICDIEMGLENESSNAWGNQSILIDKSSGRIFDKHYQYEFDAKAWSDGILLHK